MKYCLFIIFSIIGTSVFSQSFNRQEVLVKWDNACAYTEAVWKLVPDSMIHYHPTEEQMSAKEQYVHIMKNMTWLGAKVLEVENPLTFEDPLSIDSLFEASCTFVHQAIEQADSLDKVVPFFSGPKTKRQLIWLIHDHHTHHRGQLLVYLRLMGIKPPSYVGW